eukprot:1392860-Amorphochlora_amoeboformis.AAC.2
MDAYTKPKRLPPLRRICRRDMGRKALSSALPTERTQTQPPRTAILPALKEMRTMPLLLSEAVHLSQIPSRTRSRRLEYSESLRPWKLGSPRDML